MSRRKKRYGGPGHYNVHGPMFVLKSDLSLQGFISMQDLFISLITILYYNIL